MEHNYHIFHASENGADFSKPFIVSRGGEEPTQLSQISRNCHDRNDSPEGKPGYPVRELNETGRTPGKPLCTILRGTLYYGRYPSFSRRIARYSNLSQITRVEFLSNITDCTQGMPQPFKQLSQIARADSSDNQAVTIP